MDPAKIASLKRLQYARTQLYDLHPHIDHTCDPALCNPTSEIEYIKRGILPGPVVCNNIWLCRYGSYHICSANECSRAAEGVCPISGVTFLNYVPQQSNYDESDSRTWKREIQLEQYTSDPHLNVRTKKRKNLRNSDINFLDSSIVEYNDPDEPPEELPKKKFRNNGRLGKAEARRRIEKMVRTLLFDSTLRRAAAFQQRAYIDEKRAKRWRKHVQKCREERTVVNLVEQMIVDSNLAALNPPAITPHIEVDLDKQKYYVNLLMELYEKACTHLKHPKVDVEAMALAALYYMRVGYTVGGNVVLQSDAYLADNLPHVSDLPTFKYPKKKITKGTKLVKELFAQAHQSGDSQLQASIPTENVLRDNEPERLFMPTSRRRV